MSSAYLRTDEREDLLSSLKLVRCSARETCADEQFWKWVLIGTHSTLQAAIVFHLSFGNDLLVAKPRDAKKWLEAHHSGSDYPDMHMDYFLDLYEKAKAVDVLGFRLKTTAPQDESVKSLLQLRNDFVHFMPKGWSVELAGLPRMCLDTFALVEALAQGPIQMRWESDSQSEHFQHLLGECRSLLHALEVSSAAV